MGKLLDRLFGRTDERTSYQTMQRQLEHQNEHGVDMSKYADAEGRIEAVVCDCGRYRRDWPPGTYVCACHRTKFDVSQQKRLMCATCSAQIIAARSSWATFEACHGCRNGVPA